MGRYDRLSSIPNTIILLFSLSFWLSFWSVFCQPICVWFAQISRGTSQSVKEMRETLEKTEKDDEVGEKH